MYAEIFGAIKVNLERSCHKMGELNVLSKQLASLHAACRKFRVSFTVRSALTHTRLLPHTESSFWGVYKHVTVPRDLGPI